MDLSYQLYSSRTESDLAGVLKHLADTGYTQVEGFGGVMGDPAGLRAMMDDNGLTMPSGCSVDLRAPPPRGKPAHGCGGLDSLCRTARGGR